MCDTGTTKSVKCYTEDGPGAVNNLYVDFGGETLVTVMVPVWTSTGALSNVVTAYGLADLG